MRSKAFLISLLLMPVVMAASVMLVRATKDARDTKDRTFGLVDYTGVVAEPLKALADMYNGGAPSPMDAVLPRNGAHFIPVEIKASTPIPISSAWICRSGFAPKSSHDAYFPVLRSSCIL